MKLVILLLDVLLRYATDYNKKSRSTLTHVFILQVAMKRWKVDTNARQDANLLLSSVSLPGGVQRRKNESDELQMRHYFAEGDVLVVG